MIFKGLLKWNVMGRDGKIYETSEEVAKTDFACLIRPYMFPPEESVGKELHLDRCIRILPHHQNTGGFFIALIRKLPVVRNADLDANYISTSTDVKEAEISEKSEQPPDANVSKVMKAPPAKRLKHVWLENPFQFFDNNPQLSADWPKIKYIKTTRIKQVKNKCLHRQLFLKESFMVSQTTFRSNK